ncbi:MAG: mechanosensitive ion channel family protein [Rugosibacter sp.]|nr:MAG: mechanosensitive ion channel family protein [Rugosibacter sp.]
MTDLQNLMRLFCRLLIILCLSVSIEMAYGQPPAAVKQAPSLEQAKVSTSGPISVSKSYPVKLRDKTLFSVQEKIYSVSAEERARLVSERIRKLYEDPKFSLDEIHVEEMETNTEIVAADVVIMAVIDQDGAEAGLSRQELAAKYAQIIKSVVRDMQHDYSVESLTFGAAWTALATVVLILAFYLSGKISARVCQKLVASKGYHIRALRIQRVTLLSAERIASLLVSLVKVVKIGTMASLFYFYLTLVFSFFPWTQGWTAILIEFILRPVRMVLAAAIAFLPNIFFIGVISVVTFYSIKLTRFIFTEIDKGTIRPSGFYADWADPTFKICRFLILAFAAVVMFPYLPGAQSPAFQGISVFLGVLFSLGSTSAVSNIVAGVVLTYTRAFQIGDRVKIGDTVGDIVDKTLLVTRVRTIKNVETSIPNAMVLSSHIVNFSTSAKEHGLILHTSVTIGYDVPWRQVHELLIAAATLTSDILNDPKPFVLQTSLDDFYVSYELNAYTNQPASMARIYSDLHQNIPDGFNGAGVEIMSPHYGALRDGNNAAVPTDYLPKDYSTPSFRFQTSK